MCSRTRTIKILYVLLLYLYTTVRVRVRVQFVGEILGDDGVNFNRQHVDTISRKGDQENYAIRVQHENIVRIDASDIV